MNEETRRTAINVGAIAVWLVFMFVVLPWMIDQLGAIPLDDVPSLLVSGFGLTAWMLFRVEQAIDRGVVRLDARLGETVLRLEAGIEDAAGRLNADLGEASIAPCKAVGRVESDTEMMRDALEQIQSAIKDVNASTETVAGQLSSVREDASDVIRAAGRCARRTPSAQPGCRSLGIDRAVFARTTSEPQIQKPAETPTAVSA